MLNRPFVVVVMENVRVVCVLRIGEKEIQMWSRFSLRTVVAPSYVTVDREERLWIVGGPQASGMEEAHIAIFRISGADRCTFRPSEFSVL